MPISFIFILCELKENTKCDYLLHQKNLLNRCLKQSFHHIMSSFFRKLLYNIQPFCTLILYIILVIAGLCISITAGLTTDSLDGNCILYATVRGRFNLTVSNNIYKYGSSDNCGYVIYCSIVACIIYGAVATAYHGFYFIKGLQDENIYSSVLLLPWLICDVLGFILLLVAACLVSVGFDTFCRSFSENSEFTCESVQKYFTSFNWMATCQTFCWIAVLIFIILNICNIGKFIRNQMRKKISSSTNGGATVPTSLSNEHYSHPS